MARARSRVGRAARVWLGRLGSTAARLSLASLAGVASCAPSVGTPFDTSYAAAERAESAGRLDEALAGFERAAVLGRRHGDADQARWAAVDVLVRQDRVADAVARLDAIAAEPASPLRGQAAYRAAILRIEHGDAERGYRDLERVARVFPTRGVGHPAVRKLVAHADVTGLEAGLDELRALAGDLDPPGHPTELAELVAYLTAEHLDGLGQTQAARDAFARIAQRWPYPYGAFFDGALWKASLLDEKLGRPAAAAAELEAMVAVRETTSLMGSYERQHFVPAMLRLGALYRDALGDHPRARATFHRLYTDFQHSTMRDDALWLEAALWKQDGDASMSCRRLGSLVTEFPESRYVPCATAQCPGLPTPARSGAPAVCPDYVLRPRWSPGAEGGRPSADESPRD